MQNDFRPGGPVGSTVAPEAATETPKQTTTRFQTPEQVSQHEPSAAPAAEPHHQPRGSGHHWFNLPWPPNRLEIITSAVILVLAAGGTFAYVRFHKPAAVKPAVVAAKPVKKETPPKPTTVPSTLSGLPVDPSVNQRPVVAAMVENSIDARPQAGLSQAGVVFEAVAEGGVTRFMALYQDQQPTNIGPIRSARPYYIQWEMGFNGLYAHVGGSPDALADIKSWGVQDLDQFHNAGVYHRVSSRPAPHNVYASVVDLANLGVQKGYTSSFTGFVRKPATPTKTPTATSIDMNLSGSVYNPHYTYDGPSNSYLRSEGGATQVDSNTGKQLAPDVVIAIVVPVGRGALDASGAYYSNYDPIGSGTAYVFQDGTVAQGSWTKSSNQAQLTFTTADGQPLALDPGQTWITAIPSASKVSYH